MRILLIRHDNSPQTNGRLPASLNRRQGVLPHLGMGYIASALLQAGHVVRYLDLMALGYNLSDAYDYIRIFNPDLIGLTALTPSAQSTIVFASMLKDKFSIPIMVGGAHTSAFPNETGAYFDYVFQGEAEEAVVAHCADPDSRRSIYEATLIRNIDNLAWPAYHLMPIRRYSSIIGLHPAMTMISSRGCPYHCSFCAKTPADKVYRYRNTDDVADEMAHLVEHYGVKEILFYDDLMPANHAMRLSESILRKGVKVAWETPQRVDLVNRESLALMKRAGCRMLRFGVEQGDPGMMHKIEKRITLDKVREAFALTREAGIETFAYFMVGYLGETPATIKATIDLAKELDPRYVMFTKAIPLPNTKFFEEACEQGIVDRDYWRDYSTMARDDALPDFVAEADRWVMRAYRAFYLRPARFLRQARDVRNWSDVKKNLSGLTGLIRRPAEAG